MIYPPKGGRKVPADPKKIARKNGATKLKGKLGLGEQLFKHADVLSEKINFSAPGGPKSTIFETDDVDPLYFEVSIVSTPPDPPYMSKNGKMCYFYHFL